MPPTISANGALSTAGATSGTTITVVSAVVGQVRILVAMVNAVRTVSSVSGGGVGTWTFGSGVSANSSRVEVWYGPVTSTSTPTTVTVTWSSSVSGVATAYASQMFKTDRPDAANQWLLDTSNTNTSASGTSIPFPTLAPTRGLAAYLGGAFVQNSASAGSTSGFTYAATANGNMGCSNPAVTGSVSPTASQSSGWSMSAAGLVSPVDKAQFFAA